MAYTYRVSFDIAPEQRSELEIGASLERVISYLRALLPSEDGHVESRALSSLDNPSNVHVILESTWLDWESLMKHRSSSLTEDKVLREFGPHIQLQHLSQRVYREVS